MACSGETIKPSPHTHLAGGSHRTAGHGELSRGVDREPSSTAGTYAATGDDVRDGQAEFGEAVFDQCLASLLLGRLEVGDETAAGALDDLDEFPAVGAEVVEDRLGVVG